MEDTMEAMMELTKSFRRSLSPWSPQYRWGEGIISPEIIREKLKEKEQLRQQLLNERRRLLNERMRKEIELNRLKIELLELEQDMAFRCAMLYCEVFYNIFKQNKDRRVYIRKIKNEVSHSGNKLKFPIWEILFEIKNEIFEDKLEFFTKHTNAIKLLKDEVDELQWISTFFRIRYTPVDEDYKLIYPQILNADTEETILIDNSEDGLLAKLLYADSFPPKLVSGDEMLEMLGILEGDGSGSSQEKE